MALINIHTLCSDVLRRHEQIHQLADEAEHRSNELSRSGSQNHSSIKQKLRASVACDKCAIAKIRCTGQFPCDQCQSRNAVCTLNRPHVSVRRRLPQSKKSIVEASIGDASVSVPNFESSSARDWTGTMSQESVQVRQMSRVLLR